MGAPEAWLGRLAKGGCILWQLQRRDDTLPRALSVPASAAGPLPAFTSRN